MLRRAHEAVAQWLAKVGVEGCRLGVWRLVRWIGYMHGVHSLVVERRTLRCGPSMP